MAIILKRGSDVAGSLLKFKVELNKESIGKIAQGEERRIHTF
ncbi:MAG: hypothetical protein U5K84_14615 [Alkalibacterium sp.]|nr:hypothetical protein [Alkalibacterium sp.]